MKLNYIVFIILSLYGCTSLKTTYLASDDIKSRSRAVNKITDQNILYNIFLDDPSFEVKEAALNRITDNNYTLKLYLDISKYDPYWRDLIRNKLTDQGQLIKIFLEWDYFTDSRKSAFNMLTDTSLLHVIKLSTSLTCSLAAKIRIGQITWKEAILNDVYGTTNIMEAARFFDSSGPSSSDIMLLCHNTISKGVSNSIDDLIELLNRSGDKELAEDYLNCGESRLENAAKSWANGRGFRVNVGTGSHRVSWGGK